MFALASALFLGLLQGLRHAFEPDHLAAVSTLVVDRPAPRRAMMLGTAWGIGHGLTLLVAAMVMYAIEQTVPPRIEPVLEFAVAIMLIGLGVRSIWIALSGTFKGAPALHHHGSHAHVHATAMDHLHVKRWTIAKRPLAVGLMHGLAGSGALMAWVMAQWASAASGLAMILLFSVGATVSMALLTMILGWPLQRFAQRPSGPKLLMCVAGLVSVAIGIVWGVPRIGEVVAAFA